MNEQGFKTPILFIIFNRPDTTKRVFEVIRKMKPRQLFVVADGPRANKEGEEEKCRQAKAIVDQVDWNCEVHKNYADTNLGCRKRVSTGIDWFFENVEEGIILEDDCLPSISFFKFCEDLLLYYRNNEKIMLISGDNFQFGRKRGDATYYFSRYPYIWGWASWRRAWEKYNVDMQTFPEFERSKEIEKIWTSKFIQNYWLKIFNKTYNKKIDTWDYQLTYAIWKNNGLTIVPNINLVSNIGFGEVSTHTGTYHRFANLKTEEISEKIIHPAIIKQNEEADSYYNKNLMPWGRVLNKIKFLRK